jgi:adenosylmethionine-8-amino-7-oxononanoate aminotransferase
MSNLLLHFSKSELDDLLVLERGEGPYSFDTQGRRDIDALSSLSGGCERQRRFERRARPSSIAFA